MGREVADSDSLKNIECLLHGVLINLIMVIIYITFYTLNVYNFICQYTSIKLDKVKHI